MNNSKLTDKIEDECGVFGILGGEILDISSLLYSALNALQHRGQESCGIAVADSENINCYKGMGLVSNVFNKENFSGITGNSAIGHVRYSTCGDSNIINAQPILNGNIAVAHNGNLTNAKELRANLEAKGVKFNTTADSEVILKLIESSKCKTLEDAILEVMKQIDGGYSVLLYTEEKLFGFRDPKGIRPLCIGTLNNSFVLSSESCALDSIKAELIRDVYAGEIITIDSTGIKSRNYCKKFKHSICAFEYIYFARPDSVIDRVSVYQSRINAGRALWDECPTEADIVIGVPQSGILSAVGFAKASSIPYDIGFEKNEYVGRTFIEPSKKIRQTNLELKLNVIKDSVKNKRVVVVDDSIVRGTTSKRIVQLLRNAGAKEIHFRAASPIIKYSCFWGINTSNSHELVGSRYSIDEIKDLIGVDSLQYLSIKGLLKSIGKKEDICLQCFIK